MVNAPIAIFCYNRPDHLKRLIKSLTNCPELADSEVRIYQDGPANQTKNLLSKHGEVRKYIDDLNIGKDLQVYISNSNKGLAQSIRVGIDDVLTNFNKVIVLEDDLEVSPGFLKYMNEALRTYQNEESVMHISGYMFPINTNRETFFLNYTSCWGWATWKRAWLNLEWDCLYLYKALIQKKKWEHFTLNNKNGNEAQLIDNIHGKINTWAIRWQGTIEINDGFCLHPGRSLVQNHGFDGSGIHCGKDNVKYFHESLAESIKVEEIPIAENTQLLSQLEEFYSENPKLTTNLKTNPTLNRLVDLSPRKVLKKLKPRQNPDYDPEALSGIPRFTNFTIQARNYTIQGCDKASFKSMWNEIFKKEIYEFNPKHDNPVILDIGANIGLSALYFSETYPTGRIYAYEADPEIFDLLTKNINNNGIGNVSCVNSAIWKTDGTISFHNTGADSGFLNMDGDNANTISVKALSLETLLNSHSDDIDLLKMDIEGAEIKTILSYPEGLKKIDHLFVEYHSFENQEQALDLLLSVLTKTGFRYKIFNVHDVMPKSPFINRIKYGTMDLQVNIFAFRR